MNKLIQILEEEKNDMLTELTDLGELFNQTISNDGTSIDIEDFEEYLLPYIIGEIEPTLDNYETFVANYIGLATKATMPIFVTLNGEIKYKLPPMMSSPILPDDDKINLAAMHGSQKQSTDGKTTTLFRNGLQEFVNVCKKDNSRLAGYLHDINRIKADYGVATTETKKNNTPSDSLDDFLD